VHVPRKRRPDVRNRRLARQRSSGVISMAISAFASSRKLSTEAAGGPNSGSAASPLALRAVPWRAV